MIFVAIAIVLAVAIFLLRARAKLGSVRAGDFVKTTIPRTLDKPLAMARGWISRRR